MRIFLVGFMGSGKTKIGIDLAKRLNLKFIDSDKEIEKKTGKTISRIFKDEKEKKFREYEKNTLIEIADKDNIVVATGGGIVLYSFNRKLIKKKGIVIWLSAGASQIFNRIKKETHRPLLEGFNKFERINELLNKRIKYYKEVSDFKINTDVLSIKEINANIIDFLKSNYSLRDAS